MISQLTPQLFIFVALECEAKPMIRLFGLKKQQAAHAFAIYKNNEIALTVTGVGKVAMAGGVAYTLALYPDAQLPVMLNIGIAGHKSKQIGSLMVASKIVDVETEAAFYPQLIGNNWPDACTIKTSSIPATEYNEGCLYDMEVAAFYEMAARFSSGELIHCIKVISDNDVASLEKINAKLVTEWIDSQISCIEPIVLRLSKLRQLTSPIELEGYSVLLKKWHFTVSGEIRLKALLLRWYVLTGESWISFDDENFRSGKDVLRQLTEDVEAQSIYL